MKQIRVQDLMNQRIPRVSPDASVDEAAIALLDHDASQVYIVDRAGRLIGIVPEYELLKARLCGTPRETVVSSLMSTTLETADATATAMEIAGRFRDGYRSCMPVVDDLGRLVGQLTRREVIWLLTTVDRINGSSDECHAPAAGETHESLAAPQYLRRRRILGNSLRESWR